MTSHTLPETLVGHCPSRVVSTQGREQLIPLAPGCVQPTGWVRQVAEIEKNGWMQLANYVDPHNFKTSFYDGSVTAFGGEHAGYWHDATIGLAFVTGDQAAMHTIRERIEAMLAAAQQPEKFLTPHYNGWGAHLMIMALMTYFEGTGDRRVLELCHRVALELNDDLQSPEGTAFQGDHPVNMASSCAQLYGYTGDQRLMPMAEEIMRRFDYGGLPNLKRLLHDYRLSGHCVNYCEDLRHPAEIYLYSGNAEHLQASRRGVQLTARDHLQIQGAPTGNEMVYGVGPFKETEHCDTVEWSFVGHALLAATGEAHYADLAERALFNAWAGSRKWDGRSLPYNHAPNQLTAASWEGGWAPRQNLSPWHDPQCCNLNSHRALPHYARRMWMFAKEGGLAAVYYGACTLRVELPGKGIVELTEETEYPFDEHVAITVTPEVPKKFALSLRIPGWCRKPKIRVNGKAIKCPCQPGTFAVIERRWSPGDRIELHLPMPVSLEWAEVFEETLTHDPNLAHKEETGKQWALRPVQNPLPNKQLVAVTRGPLVYTLQIKHTFKPIEKPESVWSSSHYNIYINPVLEAARQHPQLSEFKAEEVVPAEPNWNLALLLDPERPEQSFKFKRLELPAQSGPFQSAPVALTCPALRVPGWQAGGSPEKPVTTLPPWPLETAGEPVEAVLAPFGCTNIRLTWLPFVFR